MSCLPGGDGIFRRGISGGLVLLVALATAGWDLPCAVADGTPVVINCSQPPQVKPEHIILTCADATLAVDKIVWNSWTNDGATGHGVEFQDNCVPNCAQGSATYAPVTITLTGATPPDFRYPARWSPTRTPESRTPGRWAKSRHQSVQDFHRLDPASLIKS